MEDAFPQGARFVELPRYGGAFFEAAGVSTTSERRQNPMKVFCDR
jgi:hypothetical protein